MQLPLDMDGPTYVPGFVYMRDFIDVQEESELLNYIATLPLKPMQFHQYEAKRKVLSFGYDYHFQDRALSKGDPIPELFHPLIQRVATVLKVNDTDITELLVTEYPPGSVINWHRDAPPFKSIAGLSLLSDCSFRLRPYDKTNRTRHSTLTYPVQRRSLYLIQDEARSEWEHSIQPVRSTRYSVTFRTLVNKNG
jgi:alkylated DNA repair dioxygenase AlkB